MIAQNPFTPKSGWEPKAFVGREYELSFFRKRLELAKQGRRDHFLILGDWGIGKTTLLKEFKKIAQSEGILTSLITISSYKEGNELMDGVKELVEQIPRKLPVDTSRLRSFLKQIDSLGIQVLGSGFNFSRDLSGLQPQTLLSDTLLNLWSDLRKESQVVIVLLDDVQNLSPISGIFTILKNVLSDEEIVRNTRFLFVLACTPREWSNFLRKHHPIGRFFTPRLHLDNLSNEEVSQAITLALEGTDVSFLTGITDLIYDFTKGHPYELQVLCSYLFENQIEKKVDEVVWEKSLEEALNEMGGVIFDLFYNEVSNAERTVLYLLSFFPEGTTRKEIISLANRLKLGVPEATINTSISRLASEKGLLGKGSKNGYSIRDRFFAEYVKRIKGLNGEGLQLDIQDIQN